MLLAIVIAAVPPVPPMVTPDGMVIIFGVVPVHTEEVNKDEAATFVLLDRVVLTSF